MILSARKSNVCGIAMVVHLRRREVDQQLEGRRLLDGEIAGSRAAPDLST
jgi:hypothetical protein